MCILLFRFSLFSHTLFQYSTVQYSTVQYSTVQYSTVQYSTVQYSTVQYSTVQYSTVMLLSVGLKTFSFRLVCIMIKHKVRSFFTYYVGNVRPDLGMKLTCNVKLNNNADKRTNK